MISENILDKIKFLYGPSEAEDIAKKLGALMKKYEPSKSLQSPAFLDQRDIFLITYADSIQQKGVEPLKSLYQFAKYRLKDIISIIHILPFFPYSSDDGFSVIDYRQVNPHHGNWDHIRRLKNDFNLCFDLVINHVSSQSHYFKGFIKGDPCYKDFFIVLDPHSDTTSVVRPRSLPLLHKYATSDGDKWCWTTFSDDQIDFNFKCPDVLLEILDILLFYVSQGARLIRLDAIAYLWKQLGTSCVHLPQTYAVTELMRSILDELAPEVLLLSETNFPHEDNISYFGSGNNMAQIVYNFPMPPLVLHTLNTGNSRHLNNWAKSIKPVSDRTTFLNFTSSHDGIGVRPAADILNKIEFNELVKNALKHGGKVSYKNDQKGKPIPYELNINYYDALNNPNAENNDEQLEIRKFLLSQSISLVFQGLPAIYIHSIAGSRNWTRGIEISGQPRSINREKLDLDVLEQQFTDEESRRHKIYNQYSDMIKKRRSESAFHPLAEQTIIEIGDEIFALKRTSRDKRETILAIHNVTDKAQKVQLFMDTMGAIQLNDRKEKDVVIDILTDEVIQINAQEAPFLELKPYQFVWLKT